MVGLCEKGLSAILEFRLCAKGLVLVLREKGFDVRAWGESVWC